MIWFKHPTDSSTHDQLISRVEDHYGLEGYARLYKLIEAIVSQMKKKEDDPSVEYPESKWCQILKCKSKRLGPFLGYLQHIQAIKLDETKDGLRVTFLKLSDLLDNRSTSSRLRGSTGHPRKDENVDKEKEDKQEKQTTAAATEDSLSWLTEPLNSDNAKVEVIRMLVWFDRKRGLTQSMLPQIYERIRRQFKLNEKSQRYGEVIVSSVKQTLVFLKTARQLPKILQNDVSLEFFEQSLKNIRKPFGDDPRYVEAYQRCKDNTMTAEDIVYIKAKSEIIKEKKPLNWIGAKEEQLLRKRAH